MRVFKKQEKEMIRVSIHEYSLVYNFTNAAINEQIKNKQLKTLDGTDEKVLLTEKYRYERDKLEQPLLKEKIKKFENDASLWLTLSNFIVMLINIGSIGLYLWLNHKKDNEPILLIPFGITFPIWIHTTALDTTGRSGAWQIEVLKYTTPFMKICAWLMGGVLLIIGGTWIFGAIDKLDVKTIGIIVIVLLVVVILNQNKHSK